jgi:proline dehydrogenase
MFRAFFIYLSKAAWARHIVTRWSVAWKMASRFISGEKLQDAVHTVQVLNSKGINATLDHLGEHTNSKEAADKAADDILAAFDAICETGIRANISIKLTQIGLSLDGEICANNLRKILQYARDCQNFIRIDMEDSGATQKTLDMLYLMRQEGYTNTGIVIQSYLYRSEKDIQQLVSQQIPVRLCKGAYNEPADIAYPKKKDVDAAFDRSCEVLLQAALSESVSALSEDGKIPPLPALATHDENRIKKALEVAKTIGLPKNKLEFQMLNGIRRDLQENLAKDGYPVRVYVPYGTEWYPYFMRRLAERPANVWFLILNFFRK